MAPWGKKKKKTEEVLNETRTLIIKVKKKGIDTSQAEKTYREAKKALKNKDYKKGLGGLEEAKKSAKRAYAKGVKARLELRASTLKRNIKEMQKKNMDSKELNKYLKKTDKALEGGVKEYKDGLKWAKKGLKISEDKLGKFNKVSAHISSISSMLRRIEDFSPEIELLPEYKEKLEGLKQLKSKGKVESALKEGHKLEEEVKEIKSQYSKAYDSIASFEKVVRDADVLGANVSYVEHLAQTKEMLREGEFEKAGKIAKKNRKELTDFLKLYKDARYHVDLAKEAVSEAKSWGFSAFEADNALNEAKEALNKNEFEEAISKSKQSKEKASTVRERHKCSSDQIRSAKEEMERIKAKGMDISEIEDVIKQAEEDFDRGDYGASEEKIGRILEKTKGME